MNTRKCNKAKKKLLKMNTRNLNKAKNKNQRDWRLVRKIYIYS